MKSRSGKVVLALARWALMSGLAGVVLSLLALVDRWRAPDNHAARENLLIVATCLLAFAFVLAPFVRRAFGIGVRRPQQPRRTTLLDEMRARPEEAWLELGDSAPAAVEPAEPETHQSGWLARILAIAYLIFGATLMSVFLAMRW
jgi:hypothetical protein